MSINVAVKRGWVVEYVGGGEMEGGSTIPHSLPVQLDRLDTLLAEKGSRFEPVRRRRHTAQRNLLDDIFMHLDLYAYGQIL